MKSLRTVWLGLAIAGALLAGTAAMAQGPGGGMGMGPGGMRPCPGFWQHQPPMERALGLGGDQGRWWNRPKVIERLKLTVDQRKAMDGILLAHREKLIDLRASVERVELEMEPLISADQPDEARILSQIDKVAQARAELEKANARFLLAIRNKLTPEQWKRVQEFRADRGQERPGWHGGHGPNGHGPDGGNPGDQDHQQNPPQGAEPQGPPAPGTGDEQ